MSGSPHFKFRLYVAADTENSTQAIANLKTFCRSHLAHRHEIEIVDVLRKPLRALADGILMTPTLIKLGPSPGQKIIGTLSQPETLLRLLGLELESPAI